MFLKAYRKIRKRKILGINARNLDYVLKLNHHKDILKVDDKLLTKQLAIDNQISVPPLYHVIEYESQTQNLEALLSDHNDFVIKPVAGTGGKGILIITETIKNKYRKIAGSILDIHQMQQHVLNILSGIYSLSGYRDKAMVEYRVKPDPIFDAICFRGVPDIRIITTFGYPLMAMLRLPTLKSDGRANLHQGAIGVGIDIATGKTICGVLDNVPIKEHPDTLFPLEGIEIPYWEQILQTSAQCYEISNLGFVGIDIVIDKEKGPLVLEMNARSGLTIQIANNDGIERRYQLLKEKIAENQYPLSQRIAIAKALFSAY